MSAADFGTGATVGALQGAAVAGVPGAIIGAVLGGITGALKGKSRKAAGRANAQLQRMDQIQNAALRRNQIREAFVARSTALAAGASESGGLQSSTVQGALGSIESQFAYNSRYFDTQQANINIFNKQSKKAARMADYAGAAGSIMQAGFSMASRRPRTGGGNAAPGTIGAPTKGPGGSNRSAGMGTLGTPVA